MGFFYLILILFTFIFTGFCSSSAVPPLGETAVLMRSLREGRWFRARWLSEKRSGDVAPRRLSSYSFALWNMSAVTLWLTNLAFRLLMTTNFFIPPASSILPLFFPKYCSNSRFRSLHCCMSTFRFFCRLGTFCVTFKNGDATGLRGGITIHRSATTTTPAYPASVIVSHYPSSSSSYSVISSPDEKSSSFGSSSLVFCSGFSIFISFYKFFVSFFAI